MHKFPLARLFSLILTLGFAFVVYGLGKAPMESWAKEWFFQHVQKRLVEDGTILSKPLEFWWGATRPELPQSLYGIYALQAQTGQKLQMVSLYQAWGDGEEHQFPRQTMESLHQGHFIPLVTWEPWLSAFAPFNGQEPKSSLQAAMHPIVIQYIHNWAREAVRFGHPLILRLAHEPTNPQYPWALQYGNTAEDYRKFFQMVHGIFEEEGARNVSWMWTPYGLNDHDYYPGSAYVDWIGLDIFNFGSLSQQGTWIDFYSLAKLQVDAYRNLGKPMLATEVGTTSAGGSKSDWIRDMLRSLCHRELPELHGLVLFDIASGQTATGLPIDWSLSEISNVESLFQTEKCATLNTSTQD